jgi:hypothetical protein
LNAFDLAAGALHRDLNIAIPATYRQAGRGAGVAVRIIRSEGSDLATPFGRQVRVTEGASISVLAADCTPAKGDTWTLADGTILTAVDTARSDTGTSHTVTVR